ncbi:DUF58 domain-containing protein [Planctellipticum variicoloris]|uniref:DUF58 domain-containing protein n=1 Tax=Planctellipticum variicoloris TaxID=3064265 RepID=UPI002B5FA99F|nr:DUF58 domain-containing protein [Planctomycetaceae bacterium SH412]HTN03116.1 DUF58 domain-containing protein [Planctomycetaceae bacterium]
MTIPPAIVDTATLARLQGLELKARTIVEGYVAGLHRSPYHGFSNEFAEHREYVPGDDLRYVDWKVYGKSDRVYLKQFDEETNYVCQLLVDASESMTYRSPAAHFSKWDYAACVAASLACLITRQQDAVGAVTFSSGVQQMLRPSSTPQQFGQICHVLEQTEPGPKTSLGPVLHELANRLKRRGLVVLLSDLFDDPEAIVGGLKHFRHCRQDVIVLQIIDPAEEDFPFQDPTLFKGLEGWEDQFSDPRALRAAYQREFQAFLQRIESSVRDLQFDYLRLRTDQPVGPALSVYLNNRRRRAGRR